MRRLFGLLFGVLFLCTWAKMMALEVWVGPEVYQMKRIRPGGTHQSGDMIGARIDIGQRVFDHFYLDANLFFSSGDIRGHTGSNRALCSNISDQIYEGRFGYVFCQPTSSFIPFVGYGYFRETNHFLDPSPLCYKCTDTFNYVSAGFLAFRNFGSLLTIGLNFEAEFMINGTSKVSRDPLYDQVTLKMNHAIQLRAELPFRFPLSCFFFDIVPFVEFRHFPGRDGYPFNFIDTKFRLLGMRLALVYETHLTQ